MPGRSPDELLELVYARAAARRRRRRLQAALAVAVVLSVGGATVAEVSRSAKPQTGLQVAGRPAPSPSERVVAGEPGHLPAPVSAGTTSKGGGTAGPPRSAAPAVPALAPGVITTVTDGIGRGSGRAVGQEAAGLVVSGTTLYVADRAVGILRALDLRTGTERTTAGNGQLSAVRPNGPAPGDGGPATASPLSPIAVAAAPGGIVYVAEARRIRRIDAAGRITTVAGGVPSQTGLDPAQPPDSPDGTSAAQSTLGAVGGLAADAAGNLYFSDGDRVRRISLDGRLLTVAGGNGPGSAGDGGPAASAQLHAPGALTFDGQGDLFISDPPENRVRRLDHATAAITTVAGDGRNAQDGDRVATHHGGAGGERADRVAEPARVPGHHLDVGQRHPQFVGDHLREYRLVALALGGQPGRHAHLAGVALATSPAGPIYVGGFVVRAIKLGGGITTVAGTNTTTGAFPAPLDAAEPGPATAVATQPDGTVWLLADGGNSVFRTSAGGSLEELASGFALADPGCSSLGSPCPGGSLGALGLAVGPDGTAWVADAGRCRIFRVAPGQAPTPVAGGTTCGSGGDGGPALSALLNRPAGVATDGHGSLWIADTGNGTIRRVDPTGSITTVASGLGHPAAVAVRPDGALAVADGASGAVTLISPDGHPRQLRPPQGSGQSALGSGGIAFGAHGEVVVADTGRCLVQRIDADGTISLVAGRQAEGRGVCGRSGDGGQATEAALDRPVGVAFGPRDALWIADARGLRVIGGPGS